GVSGHDIAWDMIRAALMSVADTAILPLQDVLGLGSAARMNVPGTVRGNWTWRHAPDALGDWLADRLGSLTCAFGRELWPGRPWWRPPAPAGSADRWPRVGVVASPGREDHPDRDVSRPSRPPQPRLRPGPDRRGRLRRRRGVLGRSGRRDRRRDQGLRDLA